MGQFSLSSNPLSTLFPSFSSQKAPDFSGAFQMDLGNLKANTSPMPDYAQEFKNKMQPSMDQMKLQVGLATQDSSDPLTALKGKEMVNEVVKSSSGGTDTSGGSSFNWDAGFSALSSVGSRVGGQAGTILSGVGNVGSSIKRIADAKKGLKNGVAGAGAAKTGAIGSAIGAASDLVGSFMPQKSEYAGPKGDITQTMDSVYDGISDAAMSFGPVGMLVGGIMKGGALLGKGMNALGGGTDGMTTTDAILGSSFLNLTPIGLVNGFGGKKTNTITKDNDLFTQMGSSYPGSNQTINDALQKSGKKYGLISRSDMNDANQEIYEARRQQNVISNISSDATDRFNIRNSMSAINGNRRALTMQGGYDQASIRVGKSGLKINTIERAKSILSKYKEQQTNQLQQGGTIDPFEYYLESLPENQRDSTNFRVKDYWIFNGKPKDFKEARRRGMFTQDKAGLFHAKSIAENPETGEIEYMKASFHPTRYMESDWYEKGLIYNEDQNGNTITIQLKSGVPGYEDWKQFTNDYELVKSEPYWKYVKRQKKEVPSHKDGGTFIEISTETSIELVDPTSIPEFQNGGSINVIPDGALHARKHNMDVDGITRKGIPVVSEKDGEIEQQAEIEKEEIIFRLEVTQKLEELEKKFYSDESTQEEKDECALEAGKLLVNEILYNTQDNTNNLL